MTQYSLASGLWQTATLASTAWTKCTVYEKTYVGEITIEVFDKEGMTQLWRGDVRATLSDDDIRVASNRMIRELLWHFPALDYPAVRGVPELRPDELDTFWEKVLVNKEFFSPGQRYPVSFELASLRDTSIISLAEAKIAFQKTKTYELVKQKIPGYEKAEESRSYKRAFQKFLNDVVEEHNIQKEQIIELRENYRSFAAICDLLLTAPWSLKNEDGTIFFAGRYFVGDDDASTIIGIEAEPQTVGKLETSTEVYLYNKYYITKIHTLSELDFKEVWQRSREYRILVVGPIDFIEQQPTPADKI